MIVERKGEIEPELLDNQSQHAKTEFTVVILCYALNKLMVSSILVYVFDMIH